MKAVKILAGATALGLALAAPSAAQETLVIRGGTVHPLAGSSYVGTVVVQGDRVAAAGPDVAAPQGARTIDATGLHVYPGLFDAASTLGLTEIGSVDVTRDFNELGAFTPHLRTRTAVHPASEHLPVARANGITHTMAVPQGDGGAGFPGQGSIFSLDGWTVEEMEIEPGAAMVMDWPSLTTREFDRSTFTVRERPYREAKEEHDRAVHQLREWLRAARNYDRVTRAGGEIPRDLRLAALAPVARGEQPVVVRVERERDIREVLEFAEAEGLRLVLAGAGEAYRVADLLAQKGIPVILGPTQDTPFETDRPYDENYANPGKLHAAGVTIAFATFNSSDSRTLPYEAAMGVPYGLPREVALRGITLTPAEILGVADRVGTIEPGKLANLIVTDGDPLEITTQVRHLIVDGREVSTLNRHRELYELHRSRPRR